MSWRLWWAWPTLTTLVGLVCLGVAGVVFERAELAAAAVARGCDPQIGGGLGLLVGGGLMLALSAPLADRRQRDAILVFDLTRAGFMLPAALVATGLALPGALGCRTASRLDALPLADVVLLGAPGIALAGAGSLAVGAALGSALRLDPGAVPVVPAAPLDDADDDDDAIAHALADVEAADGGRGRFRGIDA